MADEKARESLVYRLGSIMLECSPSMADMYMVVNSTHKDELLRQWGRETIDMLKSRGIYVNEARKDPSGRW